MTERRELLKIAAMAACGAAGTRAQAPSRPRPTPAQLRWQREELALFLHFGVNTFTDREWGDGREDPAIFNPAALDARAWARTARAAGFRSLVLTAKHHDGFCLWPTATTRHSVAASPWRQGGGDLVREVADACRAEGLGLGLYCSPWDRNHPAYGDSPRYNDVFIAQLTELLTRYGPLVEVWFDGANAEGPNGRRQVYDWPRTFATVRRLQNDAVIFSDAGPDVRWVGNERGVAGDTCWSTMDPDAVPHPGFWEGDATGRLLQHGVPDGSIFRPPETDVSIRPGWFWHPAQDGAVRPPEDLMQLYFTSVGRNSKLLLNVPPTRDGVLPEPDVRSLMAFRERREAIFGLDHAAGARIRRQGWSLTLELPRPVAFDTIASSESIERGQRVGAYTIEAETPSGWQQLARGTTIGFRKIDRLAAAVTARRVRLVATGSYGAPEPARLGLHST
jgi:alpha-L-fucosidase